MKTSSIFVKTITYTLSLLLLVVILVHLFIYFMMPPVYLSMKEAEINKTSGQISHELVQLSEVQASQYLSRLAINSPYYFILKRHNRVYYFKNFLQYQIDLDFPIDSVYLNILEEEGLLGDNQDQLIQRIDYLNVFSEEFTLHLLSDLQPIDEATAAIVKIFPYSISLSVLLSLIGSWVYSRLITKPIKAMESQTRRMMLLDPEALVTVESQDEFGLLGQTINDLYQQLLVTIHSLEDEIHQSKIIESQQMNFFRSASHELKTPLTSLSVILENINLGIGPYQDKDKYLNECITIIEKMTGSINHLLQQTKEFNLISESVDIRNLLKECLEKYSVLEKSRNLSLCLKLQDSVMLETDRGALEKVFSNLIHNAYIYGDSNSEIVIDLNTDYFTIFNPCQPLTESEIIDVFQPFYHKDQSLSNSSGIGLSLVAYWLTRLHYGYEFLPKKEGMEFIIYFN